MLLIMNNTKKITFCGVFAALAVALMLCGHFLPTLTYAIPALAGLIMVVPLIECGVSWAFGCYVTSSLIIFLIGENETKILFVLLFGYYPILKLLIEKLKNIAVEWVLKLLVFNAAAIASYYIMSFIYAISFDDLGDFGRYGAYIFLGLCNIVFVVYDIGVSRIASFYISTMRNKLKKIIK